MQAENVIKEKHAGDIEQLKFIFSDESWMWKNNSNGE